MTWGLTRPLRGTSFSRHIWTRLAKKVPPCGGRMGFLPSASSWTCYEILERLVDSGLLLQRQFLLQREDGGSLFVSLTAVETGGPPLDISIAVLK